MARINPKVTGGSQAWLLGTHTAPFPLDGFCLVHVIPTGETNTQLRTLGGKIFRSPLCSAPSMPFSFILILPNYKKNSQKYWQRSYLTTTTKIYCEAHRLGKRHTVLKQSSHCHGKENADTHSLQYPGILEDSGFPCSTLLQGPFARGQSLSTITYPNPMRVYFKHHSPLVIKINAYLYLSGYQLPVDSTATRWHMRSQIDRQCLTGEFKVVLLTIHASLEVRYRLW